MCSTNALEKYEDSRKLFRFCSYVAFLIVVSEKIDKSDAVAAELSLSLIDYLNVYL